MGKGNGTTRASKSNSARGLGGAAPNEGNELKVQSRILTKMGSELRNVGQELRESGFRYEHDLGDGVKVSMSISDASDGQLQVSATTSYKGRVISRSNLVYDPSDRTEVRDISNTIRGTTRLAIQDKIKR